MPFRMRFAQGIDGATGEGTSLVESALFVLGAVQRYGNDEQACWSIGGKLRNGRSEHRAKAAGGGMDAIVFERMDSGAHPAVVSAEGNGARKGRRRKAAGTAKLCGGYGRDGRLVERVAATFADRASMDGNFSPACVTDWNGRELRQRGAAEGTGGGKECGTNCVQRTSEDARNGAPTGCLR